MRAKGSWARFPKALLLIAMMTLASSSGATPGEGARLELHNRGKSPFLNSGNESLAPTGLVAGRRGASHFAPGSIAFFSVARNAAANEWIAEIRIGTQSERLRPGDFTVRGERAYTAVLIKDGGELQVSLHPAVRALQLEATSNPVPFVVQQVFGEVDLVFLGDKSLDPRSDRMLRAIGSLIRFRIVNAKAEAAEQCTAFHIGRGNWVSNAHCLERALRCTTPDKLQPADVYVLFWTDGMDHKAPANVVAAGCSEIENDRALLDYAVFKAPGSANAEAMIASLRSATFAPEAPLELFQYWPGAGGIKAGRAVSRDAQCKVDMLAGTAEPNAVDCALNGFAHMCDTSDGSSGSPIFLRGTSILAGLHYGYSGPSYNCAIRFSDVLSDITKSFPDLAHELSQTTTR